HQPQSCLNQSLCLCWLRLPNPKVSTPQGPPPPHGVCLHRHPMTSVDQPWHPLRERYSWVDRLSPRLLRCHASPVRVSRLPHGAYEVTLGVLSANAGPYADNVHMLPDGVGDREPKSVRAVQALTSHRYPRHSRKTSPEITPTISTC